MRKKVLQLIAAMLVFAVFPVAIFATDVRAVGPTQTIRVGYVDDAGVIQSPIVSGSEGYGYEYLNKILEYTAGDYTLEFVQCTWDNYETMLAAGSIDLFGLIGVDESLEEKGLIATKNDLGDNAIFLTSQSDISIDSTRYDKLNGCTIGTMMDGEFLQSFLEEYEVDAELVVLPDDDYEAAYQTYGLDFCLVSSFQYPESDSINVLSQIDVVPVHFISTAKNQALIDDIDQAIEKVVSKEYRYQENLYQKYYDTDVEMNTYISTEELKLLQSQDVYYVGVQNLHSPFGNTTKDGEPVGVAVDFTALLSAYADISIEVIEIDDTTAQSSLEQIDFFLFPTDNVTVAATSTPYYDVPLILIDHSDSIDTADTIGILTYYGISSLKEGGKILGRNVIEYSSLDAMRKGFNSGQVESMIVTTASLNYIREDIIDGGFLSTNLDSRMALTISYPASFPADKIAIIDKIILNLDTTDLAYSLLKNATKTTTIDVVTLAQENPHFVLAGIAIVLILIGLVDERRRRALSRRINFDALTGAYSPHRFNIEVEKRRAAHRRREYRLVSVDIDNFKYINEIYGYNAGTKILKRLSTMIAKSLPKDALFTRAYADNFLIFVRKTKETDDFSRHFKGASLFNDEMSRILGTDYKFSFSIGFYDLPTAKISLSYAIDCANVARELGKQTIGTTFHAFSEEINLERAKNNEIAASMEQALLSGEFALQYQPKIDLKTERLVGAEALVRWHRNGKMVAPYHFIPLFEKNGFIQKLDFEVLAQVCQFLKRNAQYDVPKISVNLSGNTIAKTDVVANVQAVLGRYGVVPSQIDIEITETAFVGNDVAQETVAQLEALGFSISMDDFGAGISSLNRLKSLEIDTLKIDREFIVDYLGNEKGTTILKSMIGMAKALGIETVAEGIETKAQLETLRQYGCDVGQGYYFSRPIDEAVFLQSFVQKQALAPPEGVSQMLIETI